MIDDILNKLIQPDRDDYAVITDKAVGEALTAIYEIGLEVIGADEPEYRHFLEKGYTEDAKYNNRLRASQRKAWAKACGVAEK